VHGVEDGNGVSNSDGSSVDNGGSVNNWYGGLNEDGAGVVHHRAGVAHGDGRRVDHRHSVGNCHGGGDHARLGCSSSHSHESEECDLSCDRQHQIHQDSFPQEEK